MCRNVLPQSLQLEENLVMTPSPNMLSLPVLLLYRAFSFASWSCFFPDSVHQK